MITKLAKEIFALYNDFAKLIFILTKRGGVKLAKNSGDNHRHGAVCNRSQAYNPKNDLWVKRNSKTGRFMDVKLGGNPFTPLIRF